MREYASPPLVEPDGFRNATDLLVERLRAAPAHIAFEVRTPGAPVTDPWRQITTRAFTDEVRDLAKGFIAAGIQPGESLALMAPTRYEWAVADLAAWFAGAVVVPVYETSALPQVAAILADASVRLAVGGTATEAGLLAAGFERAGATPLGVWTMDPTPGTDLAALICDGARISDEELESRRLLADLDSVATIVYTSGTTAAPRGATITHRNLVGQVLNIAATYTEVVREDGNTIIFLPLSHVLARALQLICLARGMRIAHLADPREVVGTLGALRPTFLVVVPRVLQKIQAAAGVAAEKKRLGPVWTSARRTAVEWGTFTEQSLVDPTASAPLGLRVRHALFDRLFFARLRALMGGRIDYLLCGAAALDAELALFFLGIGVPVIEGYGLTETTAPLTGNLPGAMRAGSVGIPLPGNTVRISEDGEVLAKGVGVFAGYRNPPDNADAFTDGFFRTGDLGELDERGRLVLRGRIKDVIITSGGKTISPCTWEGSVETDPLVAHAVMVGEGKPYLGGLILLDAESVSAWAEREGIAGLKGLQPPAGGGTVQIDDSRLLAAIGRAVQAANAQLARSEQVRRFALLLTDLSEAGGVVTPTMKLKRKAFVDRVRQVVDTLYRDPRSHP